MVSQLIQVVRYLFVILIFNCLASDLSRATAEQTQLASAATVEDILSTEYIGSAHFSKDGRWLAYTLIPPYRSLTDFSYWMRAGGLSGHQIWIKDLSNRGRNILQPGLNPTATNFLFGLSPDSKRLVVVEYLKGRLRVVSCLIGQNACDRFEPMPDIRDRYAAAIQWNEHLAWISDDAFVMPTRRQALPGSEMRNRAATGRFLWHAWKQTWAGQVPAVSEIVSTGRDRSADWAEGELTLFDLGAGTALPLAEGRYAGIAVSPNRRHVLVARVGERQRPPADAQPIARQTHPIFDRRYELQIVEVSTGAIKVPGGPFNIDPGSLTWRSDSGAFAVFGWSKGQRVENGQFYVFETAELQGRPVVHGAFQLTGSISNPDFRWWPGPARTVLLSEGLAMHGRPSSEKLPGWFLFRDDSGPRSLSGDLLVETPGLLGKDTNGFIVSTAAGVHRLAPGTLPLRLGASPAVTARQLDYRPFAPHGWSGESYPISGLSRMPDDAIPVLIAEDGEGGDLAVQTFLPMGASWGVAEHRVGLEGARILAASHAAKAVLVTVKKGASTELLLLRQGRAKEQLAHINRHLDRIRHPGKKEISYTLRRPAGIEVRDVKACLLLPPDFDKAAKYPVVIEIYPTGSSGNCRTLADVPSSGPVIGDLWAARGFIYVRPAFPLDLARKGGDPLGGVGELLDQTISSLVATGHADPERVVLYGASQGGIAVLAAATQSSQIAAVISMHGWSDYFSHYFGARGLMRYFHLDQNGGDNRWRYECTGDGPVHGCPFGFGASAQVIPEAYARASPVARAQDISAPVMLVHTDFDYFDMAQYDEMFGALYRAGKEARYVRYWGEGHGLSSPANIQDLWVRIDDFLSENVKPAPR